LELFAYNIPRLQALEEVRRRESRYVLSPEGIEHLYFLAFNNRALAEKKAAEYRLLAEKSNG
jgi:hypothetical protein